MDFNEAQELLANAAATDPTIPGNEGLAAQEQANDAPQSPSQGSNDEASGAADSADTQESFSAINPDDLPEEMQALAKQYQAAFTRKTQELAEVRKAYESFGDTDPRQIMEAYEFVNALQTDPRVAMQVHQELSQVLQAQGFTPAEANQMAQQVQQQAPQQDDFDMSWMDDAESGYGVPPEVQQELNEMRAFRQQYEQDMQQQAYLYQIQQQHDAIRQQHPEYGEADFDRMYKIAATTGDLMSAEREYAQWKDEIVGSFLNTKKSVPATTPAQNGPAQVPQQPFTDLMDPNLEAAVAEHLRAIGEM